MKKYLNLYIFLIVSALFVIFFKELHFSTSLLESLSSKESTRPLKIANNLGYSSELFVAVKGFDEKSLDELHKIADELKKLKLIEHVDVDLSPSKQMQRYFKENYYLLADFNSTALSEADVKSRLTKLYEKMQNAFIYEPINRADPLELFSLHVGEFDRNLKLKDYGYMLKASTKASMKSVDDAKKLYYEVDEILKKYPDAISFAPFYFFVENSSYIKQDASVIITLSSVLLLLLYLVVLRNFRLFFNTVIAIATSVLAAILLSSLIFDSINMLALAFGISITTISIDYMFHYYFHNDFLQKRFVRNKEVFLGFLTTFGVFVICSFVDIELISQLSIFSAISLLCAYLLYTFVFIHLEISQVSLSDKSEKSKDSNPIFIIVASVLMLSYAYNHLSFDTDLKNLDYKNEKLLALNKQFSSSLLKDGKRAIVVSAKTKELLLQELESLKKSYSSLLSLASIQMSKKGCEERFRSLQAYDFDALHVERLGKETGFNDAFKESYKDVLKSGCDGESAVQSGFKVAFFDDQYHTIAFVSKDENFKDMPYANELNVSAILAQSVEQMKDELFVVMGIAFAFIVAVLFYVAKWEFLYPLSYLLFPLSVVLFAISLSTKLNIIHLFALIILVAIGIGYGIYMYKSKRLSQTKRAIRYALLSTFAGFGVLIFSSVAALYSIGFVITLGIVSIALLLFLKSEV